MIILHFSVFCRLAWKTREGKIVANSKEDAINAINKEFPLEFRNKPYEKHLDSLEIISTEDVEYDIEMIN